MKVRHNNFAGKSVETELSGFVTVQLLETSYYGGDEERVRQIAEFCGFLADVLVEHKLIEPRTMLKKLPHLYAEDAEVLSDD